MKDAVKEDHNIIVQEKQAVMVLDERKAAEIIQKYDPHVNLYVELEPEIDAFLSKSEGVEITKELCAEAKSLRLKIREARIGAEKTKKVEKDIYLKAGNAIQKVFNVIKEAVEDKEKRLGVIENYFAEIEKQRIKDLEQYRIAELRKYEVDGSTMDLGNMSDQVWENFLKGTKNGWEEQKRAEEEARKAAEEEERKEKRKNERSNQLYQLGLKPSSDGRSLVYKDINFHWTDITCMTDEEFGKAFSGASDRMDVLKKEEFDEQEKIRLENERLKREKEEAEATEAQRQKEEEDKKKARVKKYSAILFKNGYVTEIEGVFVLGMYSVTSKQLETLTEAEFNQRLAESIKKYNHDIEMENQLAESKRAANLCRVRLGELPGMVWNGKDAAVDAVERDRIIITYEQLTTISDEEFDKIKSAQEKVCKDRKDARIEAEKKEQEKSDKEKLLDLCSQMEKISFERYSAQTVVNNAIENIQTVAEAL